jgi:hypothetical protein
MTRCPRSCVRPPTPSPATSSQPTSPASQEELRLLEMLRHRLQLDRLIAAGIERGSRARHMVV